MKFITRHFLIGLFVLATAGIVVSCAPYTDNPVNPSEKTYTTMRQALQSMAIVESVKDMEPGEFKEKYAVYIKQPVDHQKTDRYFRQKVVISFRGFDRPTVMVTHGYNIDDRSTDGFSIAKYLNANVVQVEHRNFNESMVNVPDRWDLETQYQESADYHAVFAALKPVLSRKWMSTGTSKSGETSIDYNYNYPNDMDLCAAFCSPLTISLYDVRCGKYLLQESGTQEQRDIMDAGIRRYLTDGEQGLYKTFCERIEKEGLPKPSFSEYVFNVFDLYFSAFSYYIGEKRMPQMAKADDSVDDLYNKWYDLLVGNRTPAYITYYVDCIKWQGLFQNDYDVYKEYLNGTSFSPRNVNLSLIPAEVRPLYDAYDNSYRLKLVKDYMPFTAKPTLLVYSKDDPWTGGRPEYINPVTTKMVINPNGIHSDALINEEYYSPSLTQEIVSFVSQYVY